MDIFTGKEKRPVISPPCSCTRPARERFTTQTGPSRRDRSYRLAGTPQTAQRDRFMEPKHSELNERCAFTTACPPPGLRSTIRNAKSIHNKSRQRLSQDSYRRNSRRYLQQRAGRPAEPSGGPRSAAKSPMRERKNQGNENTRREGGTMHLKFLTIT